MQYDEFIENVRQRAALDSQDEARRITEATLATLGDRLGGGEAGLLASQLPRKLGDILHAHVSPTADRFGVEDFFQRVSDAAELDRARSEAGARTVLHVLEDAVSQGEIDDVRAQLPQEFHALFRAQYPPSAHPPPI